MAVSSLELLEVAGRFRASEREAERRSSTSRLYYGMLHFTIECLEPHLADFDRRPPGVRRTYEVVRAGIYRWRIPYWEFVAANLAALKRLREAADYDIDLGDWTTANVGTAEGHARAIASVLAMYHPSGRRPDFASGANPAPPP
jgi:hypothetical protein